MTLNANLFPARHYDRRDLPFVAPASRRLFSVLAVFAVPIRSLASLTTPSTTTPLTCHSERSEESALAFLECGENASGSQQEPDATTIKASRREMCIRDRCTSFQTALLRASVILEL